MTPSVVAVIAAKNSGRIEQTIESLQETGVLTEILVVDDGSTDDTADRAQSAGASVIRFERNRGKGAAVAAGINARAQADLYLLVDGDLADTARHSVALIDPVASGDADLSIAVFPSAGTKGGFGLIKSTSARIIHRLCGLQVREPLSGQRCIRGDLARSLDFAPRFGVEVGMTVDVVRNGGTVVEMDLPLDHEHTGRSVSGIRHRLVQGIDIARAASVRVWDHWRRIAAYIAMTFVLIAAAFALGGRQAPPTVAVPAETNGDVVLVLVGHSKASDIWELDVPFVRSQVSRAGAVLAARTPSSSSDVASAYATLSAGAPLKLEGMPPETEVGEDDGLAGGAAAAIAESDPVRLKTTSEGTVVETALHPADDTRSYGTLGTVGSALRSAGRSTAYVGARVGGDEQDAPGALVLADKDGVIDHAFAGSLPTPSAGSVDMGDAIAERVEAVGQALEAADVVVVDAGVATAGLYTDDALVTVGGQEGSTTGGASGPAVDEATQEVDQQVVERNREAGLAATDDFIASLVRSRPKTSIVIVGTSPLERWELTWVSVANGRQGSLSSESTRRIGEVALTDISATILDTADVSAPSEMVGAPMRVAPGTSPFETVREITLRAKYRESIYVAVIITFVAVQALTYLSALWALRGREHGPVRSRVISAAQIVAVLSLCFVVGSFLYRLMPLGAQVPAVAPIGLLATGATIAAIGWRMRRSLLSPLIWICGVGVVVLSIDAVTAGVFEHISLLGYSPITAARFYGMGNMGYAILGACAIVVATSWMADAPSRIEGLVRVGCLFVWVLVVDVAPQFGADFGGALTMAPVFLTLMVLWADIRWTKRRRVLAVVGVVALAAVVILAAVLTGGSTHLSRVASGDWGALVETVQRKLATNLRVMRITTWSWMVPIVMIFMIGSILSSGGWKRWFGRDRVWGVGLIGLLGFGLIGGALNDSGIVIPALVLVVVGSMMMMRVREPFADPVVIATASAGARGLAGDSTSNARPQKDGALWDGS